MEGQQGKQRISDVWFGGPISVFDRDSSKPDPEVGKRWWVATPEFNQMLKDHYEGDINAMLAAGTAEANIDNILTLDQVTRNIYKGTAKMYSGDALAQKLTK